MRLGDLDALIAEYDKVHVGEAGKARQLMESAPTIDAVPVVRCKDCKQWTGVALGSRCKRFSFPPFAYCYTNPDDFCSRGERK